MIEIYKSTQKILFGETRAKFFFILSLCIPFIIVSCNKSNGIGVDVQPEGDMLNVAYIDTTTLLTRTIKVDSVQTDETHLESYSTDALFGTYIDPVFGKTAASLYTQLTLNTDNPTFGVNPECDSVVLSLVYYPYYYGRTEWGFQNVNVYKLSEDIKKENNYYSNKTFSSSGDLANNYGFIPNPTKSDTILGELLKPQLRIPLDKYFGQTILNNQGTANLANNIAFQSYLKGFYITTEITSGLQSGEGNILRFMLADSQSKLTIFYRNYSSNTEQFTLRLGDAARFSNFKHDYSTADASLVSQLSATPPQQNDVVFLQAMAGSKVKIEMPYIMNWNNLGANGINKAELVVKVNASSAYQVETFTAPSRLALYGINDDGSNYSVPDYFFWGDSKFGGFYNSDTKEYRFNISSYIQQILIGKIKNNGLHLQIHPFDGVMTASRAVVGGGGNGTPYQMKLQITRTKIP